jgi:hypothetical protein
MRESRSIEAAGVGIVGVRVHYGSIRALQIIKEE